MIVKRIKLEAWVEHELALKVEDYRRRRVDGIPSKNVAITELIESGLARFNGDQ